MAIFVLAGALFEAAPARANVVFDFSGVCSYLCHGTATGVLTLADSYTFGTDITDADFISFDYSGANSFEITSANIPLLTGGLNADGSFNSAGKISINATAGVPYPGAPYFGADDGSFAAGASFWAASWDLGGMSTFTLVSSPVPEPSTWAMMLLGFAGLGFAGYRRVRQPRAS